MVTTRSQSAKLNLNICPPGNHSWCRIWMTKRIEIRHSGLVVVKCSKCNDIIVEQVDQKLVTDGIKYMIREDIKHQRTLNMQKKLR
jgi:hypothetical protein